MKNRILTAVTLMLLCVALPAVAQPFKTATDFDGDAISDVTYTTTLVDKLVWKSVPSHAGGTVLDESFGALSDAVVLAHWLDTDRPTICSIKKPAARGALNWKILREGGVVETRNFGQTGDLVLGGGDFNGNGFDDAAVVRVAGKKLVWGIRYDLFSESSTAFRKRLGVAGDRAFYASPDGLSDWLGVFGKSGKKTRLLLFNPETKETVSTKKVPRRFTRLPRPRPFPIKQEDGTDLIAFVEVTGTDTRLSVFGLDGGLIRERKFSGTGEVTVGNYLADQSGEEIALHVGTKIRYFNPVTQGVGEATQVAGIPIDEVTATMVAALATPTPTPTATPVVDG